MGPSLSSHHPMITLSKAGTFKPKILFPTVHQEPSRVSLAVANPLWKQAMTDQFQALLCNQTWNLVPPSSAQRVVQCKWVFQTKLMANVSLDKHKRLGWKPKDFNKHLMWTSLKLSVLLLKHRLFA